MGYKLLFNLGRRTTPKNLLSADHFEETPIKTLRVKEESYHNWFTSITLVSKLLEEHGSRYRKEKQM